MDIALKKREIRKLVLNASYEAGACHIGSALSCVDTLVDILYSIQPDIFLFSKASGVATYYAILADQGYFPREKIAYYLKRYPLPSVEVPGVIHSVGSLGHGFPVAVGLAYANREKSVYTLMSDGEVQEGTTWESALFVRQHRLDNLYVFVDDNKIQGLDFNHKIIELSTAYEFLQKTLPHFKRAETIKGAGVDFMENDPAWHYKNLTPELLEKALQQI